jgi:hypothetical protein
MMLRNRWIVRAVNPYIFDRPEGATHCVECGATALVAFYGSRAECIARCGILNAGTRAATSAA